MWLHQRASIQVNNELLVLIGVLVSLIDWCNTKPSNQPLVVATPYQMFLCLSAVELECFAVRAGSFLVGSCYVPALSSSIETTCTRLPTSPEAHAMYGSQ